MPPVFANPATHPVLSALRDDDRDRVVALVRYQERWWRAGIMVTAVAMALYVWPVVGRALLIAAGLDLDQIATWYSIAANFLVFYGGLIGWIWFGVVTARRVPANIWLSRHVLATPCPGCLYQLGSGVRLMCPECGEEVAMRDAVGPAGVRSPAV